MKKSLFSFISVAFSSLVYSQCLTVTCPSNITATNAANACSAIVNYSAPLVVNTCSSAASTTFAFTGSVQSYVVPAGVTSLTFEAWGAQGGANWVNNVNYGGYSKGVFTVVPSQTLQIFVGGQATSILGGFNGGGNGESAGRGGGGGTDIRVSPYALADRIIVAGGGGGAGYWSNLHVVGGVGGGLVGGDGYRNTIADPGGVGGSQTQAGPFGTCSSFSNPAVAGSLGVGGSVTGCGCEGYGGGGGYYGGAGSGNCRGGGGGSGYLLPTATGTNFTSGINIGNGKVVITSGSGVATTFTNSLVSGLASGSSFSIGTTVQTFTVVDNLNNSASCSFSVTVTDVQLPAVVCPSNAVACVTTNSATVSTLAPVTLSDNCSAALSYSLVGATTGTGTGNANGVFNLGVTSVSYKAIDPSGNSATCNFSVTVIANPTVSIANTNTTICAGQTATLTANGASTYVWNTTATTSSIVISPTATTVYNVVGTANTCTNTATFTQAVIPTPTVNAISSTSLICVGQSASLTASGASTYTWNTNATTSAIVVSPTITTTYTVNGTAANGCSKVATVTQNVSACTNLNVNTILSEIAVYPNPTNGMLTIELPNGGVSIIQLINSIGQIVVNEKVVNEKSQINLQHLPSGIYFLKANTNGQLKTVRIIKN